MLNPPLMLITWPVIQLPASDARSATIGATSDGWPRRRIGYALTSFSRLAFTHLLLCADSLKARAIELAVAPVLPISRASDFISAMVPARAAAAIASPDSPTRDESPMMEIIRPRLDASNK